MVERSHRETTQSIHVSVCIRLTCRKVFFLVVVRFDFDFCLVFGLVACPFYTFRRESDLCVQTHTRRLYGKSVTDFSFIFLADSSFFLLVNRRTDEMRSSTMTTIRCESSGEHGTSSKNIKRWSNSSSSDRKKAENGREWRAVASLWPHQRLGDFGRIDCEEALKNETKETKSRDSKIK